MITNIINPLLQAVSFISIWYLYQTMSKVKPLRGHLLLLFLSYVAAASYFNLVKIVIDPLFFLVADLALVKERSFYHRLLYAFYPTILFDMATGYFHLSSSLTSYISKVTFLSIRTYIS